MIIRDKTGKEWECVLNSAQKTLLKIFNGNMKKKQVILIKRRGII
jgi:hypothetical protein